MADVQLLPMATTKSRSHKAIKTIAINDSTAVVKDRC